MLNLSSSSLEGPGTDPDPSGAAPAPTALCNTAVGCTGLKTNVDRRWWITCDKLALRLILGREGATLWDALPFEGTRPDGWRPGKRRGTLTSEYRGGAFPGMGGEPVAVLQRRFGDSPTTELLVDLNPTKQGEHGLRVLGQFCRAAGVDPLRAWLDRLDVAHDIRGVDRSRFRFDAGMHRPTLYGVSSSGPETEAVGYRKGWDVQGVLYDKRAELIARGGEDEGNRLRFEVRRRREFEFTDGRPAGEARLADLPSLAWPGEPGWYVREFVNIPDGYGDDRYLLLNCAAWVYGTRAAEAASRRVLRRPAAGPAEDGSGVDQLRGCCWPEVDPCPREAFRLQWPHVADWVLRCLAAG